MAGIEHRTKEGVMQAFEYFDKPVFAIYVAKDQRTSYEGDSVSDAANNLDGYLDMIEAGGTATTYTLRVYPAGTKDVNSKTPHSGSTTFMLSAAAPVKTENGVMIFDRQTSRENSVGSTAIMSRLDNLEKTNQELTKQLFEAKLAEIEARYKAQAQIGALSKEPEKHWSERMFDMISGRPEIVDKLFSIFKPTKNYIQSPSHTAPIAGTEKTEHVEEEQQVTQAPYTPPGLTDEQIQALSEEEQEELQVMALDSLEERIGMYNLTRMVLAVAALDNKGINKLLTYLE